MINILKKIDGLFITPVSGGADEQNKILRERLPFKVLEYKSGSEHNGWRVPYKWEVAKAEIRKNGKLIYDGKKHPLGVIGYSQSFKGKVSLAELKKHLYYYEPSPEDIVYHYDLYYKPHRKIWGFSLPYNLYKTLRPGKYDIDLETSHTPGAMKVLEYVHQGDSAKTIILNAHNCHAAQLNDGPAGYVVLMEAMRRLKSRRTKYTYRLVIGPEIVGTVFYLAGLSKKITGNFKLGIFLEMVGHNNPIFSLQESLNADSLIDKIAHHVLKHKSQGYWSAPYRTIIGNDESAWESPGYGVPMISLSRCQAIGSTYPQYHLSSDNIKIIKNDKLEETVDIIMQMLDILEKDCCLKRKFTGLVALSNPKYNLYITAGKDPAIKVADKKNDRLKWHNLIDRLPRYMNGNFSILDIAIKHNLPFDEVYNYLLKFKQKGLVDFMDKELI